MSRILLGGYLGCGNVGDDALLAGLLSALDKESPGHHYEVLSGSPDIMRRKFNLQGVPRRDKKAVHEAIESCDVLIFPGGSIFQDVTSIGSPLYYKDLVIKAKKAGKRVLLLAQGVGPLKTYFGKKFSADAFRAADVVTVRDPASAAAIRNLGVERGILVTADSAFLLPPPAMEDDDSFGAAGIKTIGICPRPFGDVKKSPVFYSELCKALRHHGYIPSLIEMDEEVDGPLIDEIEKVFGGRISHIKRPGMPSLVQSRMARMDGVIAVRLHGAVLAATVGQAPFILSYDPKTLAIASQLGLPTPFSIDSVKPEKAVEAFLDFQKRRETHQKTVASKMEGLRKAALQNVDVILRTLTPTATLK